MKKLFTWIFDSNRPKHMLVGLGLTITTIILCFLLSCNLPTICIMPIWVSLVAGISADFKDYQHGDLFDILDVLATILPSIVISALLAIFGGNYIG